MTDRNATISIMKGLAIIFMVMGHSWTGSIVEHIVGMFHMPLFFFVAGYCLKEKYFDQKVLFVRKRLLSIYLPLLLWTVVFIALNNVLVRLGVVIGHSDDGLYSVQDAIYRFVKVAALRLCTEDLIGGYWFLPTFLIASCISLLVCWACNKVRIQAMWALLLLLAVSMIFKIVQGYMIYAWEISAGMFGAFFYVLGYVCKNHHNILRVTSIRFILAACTVALGCLFWRSGMTSCSPIRMPFYVPSAFSGIILTMWISERLSSLAVVSRSLRHVGDHTLGILTWHMSAFKLLTAIIIVCFGFEKGLLLEYPTVHAWSDKGLWVLYAAIGVVLPLMISYVYSFVKGKVVLHGE